MKRQIRFKVKHILGLAGAMMAIVILVYAFLPATLLSIAEGYYSSGEREVAKVYYERIDNYFPNRKENANALEQLAQLATYDRDDMLVISPMGIGGGHGVKGNLPEEARAYYTKLVERFPATFQGRRALMELTKQEARDYVNSGKPDEAVAVVRDYYQRDDVRIYNTDVAMDAARAMQINGYNPQGIEVLEYALEENENVIYPELFELAGDLYAFMGDKENARAYYEKTLRSYEEIEKKDRELIDEGHPITKSIHGERKEVIAKKMARLTDEPLETGAVKGTITLSGEPLSDVQMMLQPLTQPNVYPVSSSDAIWVVTDSQGQFTFEHISPSWYALGFVLDIDRVGDVVLEGGHFPQSKFDVEAGETYNWDFNLVETMKVVSPVNDVVIKEDTIEFSWEQFPDAAYYKLELGMYLGNGSSWRTIPEEHPSNRATLSIEELQSIETGVSYDEEGPTPESLFGYAIMPEGKYFWGVIAYDEEGNILSASRGYLKEQNTDFSFGNTEMTEGDRLLLDRQYGEAIEAYGETLTEEPNNLHALRMLASMHRISISNDIADYPYTDYNKAVQYFERLYELTGDTVYLDSISGLYYHSLGEYGKALTILKKKQEIDQLSPWQQMMLARLESHFGNYHEGLKQLSFEMIEPSLRREADSRVQSYISRNQHHLELARIASTLFLHHN
ncbi:tetratricopeptide (TPR) repeat protein [Desulfitispora alkaliphila]|uniref:tetratricopeptide repeat protein n=1 Tax=Desulfitispora alkaliphila TaxID=622674 RepID=UPI003D1CACB4